MIWLVGIGGAMGAASRFLLGKWINKHTKTPFPISTWIINIIGSFLLGVLVNLHFAGTILDGVYLFLGIGFCGAFTTFSTFTNEAIYLFIEKRGPIAFIYILSSVVISLISAFIGITL